MRSASLRLLSEVPSVNQASAVSVMGQCGAFVFTASTEINTSPPISIPVSGIPLGDVMAGLTTAADTARIRYGMSIHSIACFLRDKSADEVMRTLQELGEFSGQIIGIGLDSAEVGFPPSKFQKVFEIAADMGFRRVAHAGEEGPPEYIWQVLDILGVERIDHGIRCVEDDQLIRRLVADQIPLTVCPLSNVRLKCVESLGDLMLPKLERSMTMSPRLFR